jgi:EmrB/QacA subfamily drug resistance transporter
MAGIAVVMALIALDQTVVGTALPQMVSDLQGFGWYPWVAAAYLLTNAILIPVTGRLGDLYGRKPFLLAAIILFTLASALCGMASNMWLLVLARGLQGIGGGMLVGSAFASVSDLFPDTLVRVRWQVMLSASFGVASALGPVLGGVMTEHLGWRSVFYVNLPVGLIALPVVWRFLPWVVQHQSTHKSMDWWGVALLTLAMSTLLITTEMGQTLGFTSLSFWTLVALSVLFGGLFVRHQHSSTGPVIPMELFDSAVVRRLAMLSALTGLILFVMLFYAPLLLQGGFGLTPKQAGLLVTPLVVGITLGSIINGRLISRLAHPERLFSLGVLLLIVGIGLLCLMTADTPHATISAIFGLCGLSLGFQLPNLTLQMQSAVGAANQGAASALIQTLRSLGSMFGASLAGLVVSLSFSRSVAQSLNDLNLHDTALQQLLNTPQVLIRAADQDALWLLGHKLGFDSLALLQHSRLGLAAGIHEALAFCVVLSLGSFVLGRKLPAFVHRNQTP